MHELDDLDGTNAYRAVANSETISLTLMAPSGFAQGQHYYPAESLTISGVEAIAKLREVCEQMIEAHAEATQG